MARKNYEKKYTKPELREKIKEELKASDKGGKKGKWSARKSQLLVSEYEKNGGGYKQDKNNEEATSLREWTDQDWQTRDGKGRARSKGTMKRYLPKKVWDQLSDQEKERANRIKEKADQQGQHKVQWTPAIKKAFEKADFKGSSDQQQKNKLYQKAREFDLSGRSKMNLKELKDALREKLNDQLNDKTKNELYHRAQHLNVKGRSNFNRQKLKDKIIEYELKV